MLPRKKLVHIGARDGKQFGERPELVPAQVPQLFAVDFLDWFIQASQKLESLWGNPSDNCATVFVVPRPRDQAPFLHTVEQAGHIGIPCNHAAGDLATGEPLRGPAQNAEYVVLGRRDVLAFEKRCKPAGQQIASSP